MSKIIRVKRGQDLSRQSHLIELGELVWTTDKFEMWVGDGVTLGGIKLTGSMEDYFIPITEKATADGVATLDATGKVPFAQIPAVAISQVWVVSSLSQQLALPAETGDIAVRTDENLTYIHNGGASNGLADWTIMLTPTDTIQSVNNDTGPNVVLSLGDIDKVDLTGGVTPADLIQWDGANWVPVAAADIGRTTFTSLSDTPASTVGSQDFFVQVDSTNNKLIYTDIIDGGTYSGTGEPVVNAPVARLARTDAPTPRAAQVRQIRSNDRPTRRPSIKRPNIKRI